VSGFGKIIRPTSGSNAPRNVNTSGRGNQPFRYVRPMGIGTQGCTTRYFDPSGAQVWHKNHRALVRAVAIDDDGNIYEAGDASGGVTIRKRDSTGDILWQKSHGVKLNCVALTSDGVVAGGEVSGGAGTVIKWQADGTEAWSASTAGPVIKIAADSGDAVAALESLASPNRWASLIYAFSSAGVAGQTQQVGASSGIQRIVATGVAFGVPSLSGYSATFSNAIVVSRQFTNFSPASGWDFIEQQGFGDTIGTIGFSGNGFLNSGTIVDIATHERVPSGSVQYVYLVATDSASYGFNIADLEPGVINHDTLYSQSSLCVASNVAGDVITATDVVRVFRFHLPIVPATPRWDTPAEWQYPHNGIVYGVGLNSSGYAVSGGEIATI